MLVLPPEELDRGEVLRILVGGQHSHREEESSPCCWWLFWKDDRQAVVGMAVTVQTRKGFMQLEQQILYETMIIDLTGPLSKSMEGGQKTAPRRGKGSSVNSLWRVLCAIFFRGQSWQLSGKERKVKKIRSRFGSEYSHSGFEKFCLRKYQQAVIKIWNLSQNRFPANEK